MTKRNRRFAGVSAAAIAVLIATGCDQGLTEVNVNPNAPETVPIQNLILGGIWDVAANGGNRGVFGQWTQLYHGENWAQHIAQPVYNEEDTYTPRGGIPDAIWTEMFYALQDLKAAKQLADGVDDNAWAVAEIMSVYGQAMLTDYFGDMPYTEALRLDEGITAPVYDPQSSIYPDLIARLVAAEARINTAAVVTFGDFDPVYSGDMDGWLAFANSLQLRYAMRMSNADPAAGAAAFAAAWGGSVFASNAEQAQVNWTATQPAANPVYEGIVVSGRFGDFRMSQSLIDNLATHNDPRLPIYAQLTTADGVYRGLRNGLEPQDYAPAATTTAAHFSQIGTYFLTADTPSNLLSYSEVLFLAAEAAELGWIPGGAAQAETYYDAAITAAMEDMGVAAADITTFLGQASVGYTTGTYQGLDAIRVQKWVSLFMAGPEAFSELRRAQFDWTTDAGTTGADLVPAANSDLPNPTDWPQRLFYPPEEQLYNGANVPNPAPTLTDPVWWAM